MCGIVAVSGSEAAAAECVTGLKRLQYRGYDSYGFAWANSGSVQALKSLEPLDEMAESLPASSAVIGHTRWATHGAVSLANCHPHSSVGGNFAVVHNGIVENFQDLRSSLPDAGWQSETDTEVIVRLLDQGLAAGLDRQCAVTTAFARLEGRNTICVLFGDGECFGVRHGSPLVLGIADGRSYLASDVLSIAPFTTRCFALPEHAMVVMRGDQARVMTLDGMMIEAVFEDVEMETECGAGLDEYRHYMLKETMEQWQTIPQQAIVSAADLGELATAIKQLGRVFVTGAGGAYYSARQICWLLRQRANIAAFDVPAYEMESMRGCIRAGDILLAISQSGETADTLEAVRQARSAGMRVASLVNMPLSTLASLSDYPFSNRSGPEVCVLSTKSATAQVTFGFLLAETIAGRGESVRTEIDAISRRLVDYLDVSRLSVFERAASRLAASEHIFLLGRGGYFGSALMGALNIKEASYIHAEAFTAGELKHGVIALIEPGTPVIVFVPADSRYMMNVVAEVKARGAHVVAVADEDNPMYDAILPLPASNEATAPITSLIPCQLLAYFLGVARGVNPDRPRNLAKSVTVQ